MPRASKNADKFDLAEAHTISHDAPGHNNAAAVKGVQKVITGPGEYEVGGVFITGIRMRTENKGKSKKKGGSALLGFQEQ